VQFLIRETGLFQTIKMITLSFQQFSSPDDWAFRHLTRPKGELSQKNMTPSHDFRQLGNRR
jgi:hypothetical protein